MRNWRTSSTLLPSPFKSKARARGRGAIRVYKKEVELSSRIGPSTTFPSSSSHLRSRSIGPKVRITYLKNGTCQIISRPISTQLGPKADSEELPHRTEPQRVGCSLLRPTLNRQIPQPFRVSMTPPLAKKSLTLVRI